MWIEYQQGLLFAFHLQIGGMEMEAARIDATFNSLDGICDIYPQMKEQYFCLGEFLSTEVVHYLSFWLCLVEFVGIVAIDQNCHS